MVTYAVSTNPSVASVSLYTTTIQSFLRTRLRTARNSPASPESTISGFFMTARIVEKSIGSISLCEDVMWSQRSSVSRIVTPFLERVLPIFMRVSYHGFNSSDTPACRQAGRELSRCCSRFNRDYSIVDPASREIYGALVPAIRGCSKLCNLEGCYSARRTIFFFEVHRTKLTKRRVAIIRRLYETLILVKKFCAFILIYFFLITKELSITPIYQRDH